MPTNDTIISFALAGGLNQAVDPDQLAPPELTTAVNVVARRGGRLEKRPGYQLVETATQTGAPAVAFGGSSAVVSPDVEAIGAYHGKDGARAVLAAGSRLYEYVGSDAAHGWRDVNRLPSYLGTLSSVTASGGSLIEVDAIESSAGTTRMTAWVSGTRTGQELSSDLTYAAQQAGTNNAVYFALQNTSDGAFIKPPTVLVQSISPFAIFNLRVTRLNTSSLSYAVIAFMSFDSVGATGNIYYVTVNLADGSCSPICTFSPPGAVVTGFRAFDVVGLPYSIAGSALVWSACAPDSGSSANPAELYAELQSINPTTGVASYIASIDDILTHSNFSATTWYNPWAHRGVVLEQDTTTGTVFFAARVVSRYYTGPSTATATLDGQMVLGKLTATASALVSMSQQASVPFIGFRTQDNHAYVLGTAIGGRYYSESASIPIRITTAEVVAGVPALEDPRLNTVVMTALLSDGVAQPYLCQVSTSGSVATVPTFTIVNVVPYLAREKSSIVAYYPAPVHTYPGNAPITGTIQTSQVNWIDTSTATSSGFNNGVWSGCYFRVAGINVCKVTVYVSGGSVSQVAIEDGRPASVAVVAPGWLNFTDLVGPCNPGAATITGARGYMLLAGASAINVMPTVTDVPNLRDTSTAGSGYALGATAFEHCVHRWSVAASGGYSVLALSSASASVVTTPNGDEPLGAASPQARNNFLEVYKWLADGTASGPLMNVSSSGGTSSTLIAALGGPWRLVGGLAADSNGLLCAVCPAGDDFQQSTFLISVGSVNQTVTITQPGTTLEPSLKGASGFRYGNNIGMFVESANMMRITSPPLNVPSVRAASAGFVAGALRNGSSKGTQEVFCVQYDSAAASWRRICSFSDYSYVSGGVLSAFDGVGCNEASLLVWPQQDFTSINWPWTEQDVYISDQNTNTSPTGVFPTTPVAIPSRGSTSPSAVNWWLQNISRPYFKYEAGFYYKNGNETQEARNLGNAWRNVSTNWGGDPAQNFESVYADPRALNFGNSKYGASFRLSNSKEITHYYGRYQSYAIADGGDLGIHWAWVPRAGSVNDNQSARYEPDNAGGDFLMRWCYEYADGSGRMMRSAPSKAITFTVCADIIGANRMSGVPEALGGSVSIFQYGFFVPRLELTNRLNTAASDPRRVIVQPYTTAEPYATVLYRLPFSNFNNAASDFAVSRNSTRSVVAYANASVDSTVPLGLTMTNLRCFDGPTGNYNGILTEPYLYTTSNVLDNVAPPSAKVLCVHQNRLIMGGADDPTVIWMSKELTPTEAPGFNEALTLTISDAGAVTGLASLNGNLVIFKRNAIFVVPGVLPDATGAAPSMGEPIKLPAGVGCIDHRSIVETPAGVFFQSERGLEVLPPSLQVNLIGDKILDTITTYPKVVSAIHYAIDQEVRFLLEKSDGTSRILVNYSYLFSVWSTHTINYLGGAQKMGVVDGTPWLAASAPVTWSGTPQAAVYRQSEVSALDILPGVAGPNINYVKMTVVTAPIDVHQVQGFQRVKRARLLMTNNVRPELTADLLPSVAMGAWTDYNLAPTSGGQLVSWPAAQVQTILTTQGRVQVEVHLREQKGQAVIIGYVEGGPATTPTYTGKGWGLAISNVALVVGLKKGLDKRILPDAKR